jgi:hypothetical protein
VRNRGVRCAGVPGGEITGAGELQALVQRLAEGIGRLLEKRSLIERYAEYAWLSGDAAPAGSLDELIGHCITWRLAVGPRAGQKVFTLQTVAAQGEGEVRSGAAQAGGFSLHAGVSIKPGQRAKLKRLCRYVSRGPLAEDRLTLSASGQVRDGFKTPWRDGTTHVVLEPLDFIARLAALVPPPRRHLTRYHGVFAPHSGLRALITPAGRGKGGVAGDSTEQGAGRGVSRSSIGGGAGDDGRRRRHRALSGPGGRRLQDERLPVRRFGARLAR